MKTALVIGYGSAGKRHARILANLGLKISIVSKHAQTSYQHFSTMHDACLSGPFDYYIISNNTNEHGETLDFLNDHVQSEAVLLVEKPLVSTKKKKILAQTFVGYNLRFHPVISALLDELNDQKIYSAQVYAGQYLPDWRPQNDYAKSYSAKKNNGGGVLYDLSHEFDYVHWMLGKFSDPKAIVGKFSNLEIDCEDTSSVLLSTARCPCVTITVNYTDRVKSRRIAIQTDQKSIKVDLVQNTISVNEYVRNIPEASDASYVAMHKAVVAGDYSKVCTAADALYISQFLHDFKELD